METRENIPKLISLTIIGIIVATVVRIPSILFLSNAMSYVVGFAVLGFFIYLGLSREIKSLLQEKRQYVWVVVGDIVIRTMGAVIFLPELFPYIPLEEIGQDFQRLVLQTFGFFLVVPVLLAIIILPYYFSYKICVEKNRNPMKGAVLTFIFWPVTPLALWIALKTRDPKTRQLS